MKKNIYNFFFILLNIIHIFSLNYIPEEYIIFEQADTGYDLYIKKIEGIESILLTESQKDPQFKKTNYGLRTPFFHPCNGDEIRILDGKKLHTKYDGCFLVDSTIEPHPILGDVFHFFLPERVYYGYPDKREGYIDIKPGTGINLRLFEKKYADYSGRFLDQWIILKLLYNKENYKEDVIDQYKKISLDVSGDLIIKSNDQEIEDVFNKIDKYCGEGESLDLIFIIDTTLSMKEELPIFKLQYPKIINNILKKYLNLRIGFILYRDYGDNFLNKTYDFNENISESYKIVSSLGAYGGDDIPEAVYEAICEIKNFTFKSENRIAFLIADAPPHPQPRGKITKNDAINVIKNYFIKLVTICLPYK